jgi:Tol biopolymer transport system component
MCYGGGKATMIQRIPRTLVAASVLLLVWLLTSFTIPFTGAHSQQQEAAPEERTTSRTSAALTDHTPAGEDTTSGKRMTGCFGHSAKQRKAAHAKPNGTKIAFAANPIYFDPSAMASASADNSASPGADERETDYEICVVNADGTGMYRLTSTPEDESMPAWSPDGKKIAFVSERAVYVMNADGSHRTKLPWPKGLLPEIWAWSPDGMTIAFQSNCNIYIMPASGSRTPTKLTTDPDLQCSLSPTWSADGSKIAFTSERGAHLNRFSDPANNIYVMNISGVGDTNRWRQLTDDAAGYGDLSWSPEGSEIAFVRGEINNPAEASIYKIDVNSLKETTLTDTPGFEGGPTWSPDGKQIAYSYFFERAGLEHHAIYKMNADGSNPTLVTDVVTARAYFPV